MIKILGYTVNDFCAMHNLSKSTIYDLYKKGGQDRVIKFLVKRGKQIPIKKNSNQTSPLALTLISIAIVLVIYLIARGI